MNHVGVYQKRTQHGKKTILHYKFKIKLQKRKMITKFVSHCERASVTSLDTDPIWSQGWTVVGLRTSGGYAS